MDDTTLLVMATAKTLYLDDKARRINFGQDTGPVVAFDIIKPENAQYVHDACVNLGYKCSCAPGAHDNPATFEKEKAKRTEELLATTPLGQKALKERKAREAAEQAKFEANQGKPIDKYLKMTPTGRAALDYRKSGSGNKS